MNKRHGIVLCLAAAILLTAMLLSPDSLAWISFFRLSPNGQLSASDGNLISVTESEYDGESGEYNWIECSLTDGEGYSGKYTGSFNFGKIDNVAVLGEGNVVYLQLKIPLRVGRRVTLSLSYFTDTGPRYSFYRGERVDFDTVNYTLMTEGDPGYAELYGSLTNIENGFTDSQTTHPPRPFISYTAATSDTPDTAPGEFTGEIFPVTESSGTVELSYGGEGNEGYYYVYMKLTPNLDAYVESVNYIFDYMPCILDFNLELSYSVSE